MLIKLSKKNFKIKMDILDKLIQASSTTENLENFLEINNNFTELYDFFITQSFQNLNTYSSKIVAYILPKYFIYSQLDFSKPNCKIFISFLLDVSERFGLLTEFQQLYQLHESKNIDVTSRLKAASLYLIGIINIGDYTDRIPNVFQLLLEGLSTEEDEEDKIIHTLINYYREVIYNFGAQNQQAVLQFKNTFITEIKQPEYSFLMTETLKNVLKVKTSDNIEANNKIQNILDNFLNRTNKYLPFNEHRFITEENTEYTNLLIETKYTFQAIRQIAVELYQQVADDKIFYSLQRGVKVLTEPNQLIAYMNSFGKMHYAKIISAIAVVPSNIFLEDIEIYDWGCGQGLASYILLEQNPQIKPNITLIEPSELALKRASLHVNMFVPKSNITTINKDIDSLNHKDFNTNSLSIKVHLFSNILDIDLFSMTNLIQLVKQSFSGTNYFICVSPYVNIAKTNRLTNFMEAFKEYNSFHMLKSIDEPKANWPGRTWSRVIRVFKVDIK